MLTARPSACLRNGAHCPWRAVLTKCCKLCGAVSLLCIHFSLIYISMLDATVFSGVCCLRAGVCFTARHLTGFSH